MPSAPEMMPKNDSEASNKIAPATLSETKVMMGLIRLGNA